MNMIRNPQLIAVLWTLLAVLMVGCSRDEGPAVAEVSGTITLDGQPLPGVNIQFVPEGPGGSPSFGGTNQNGHYRLLFTQHKTGAMLGQHRVEITARETPRDENGKLLMSVAPVKIPRKYFQPGALTAEVRAGSNVISFDLHTK